MQDIGCEILAQARLYHSLQQGIREWARPEIDLEHKVHCFRARLLRNNTDQVLLERIREIGRNMDCPAATE